MGSRTPFPEGEASLDHLRIVRDAIDDRLGEGRLIVAIAGAPASGKSTLADAVVGSYDSTRDVSACLVPMDGFHLDNAILERRGLRAQKGAPETFDSQGFISTLSRLKRGDEDVFVPVFDRSRDIAIAGAQHVSKQCRIVVVEGNYLLLNKAPWDQCRAFFDLTVFLRCDTDELERRLIKRWLDHGLTKEAASARARSNDIPNATTVNQGSFQADVELS